MKNIWKWIVAVLAVSLFFFGGWFWFEKGRNLDRNEALILSEYDQSGTNEQKQSDDLKSDVIVDTSNWKTYRNEALRLSFKYPDTFRLDESIRDDGHVVSVMEYDENARDLDNKPIPDYYAPIVVNFQKDLNNSHIIGGDWVGKKKVFKF